MAGQLEKAVRTAQDARAIQQRTQLADEWNAVVPLILIRVQNCLHDFAAAEREADAALAAPDVAEPVRLVMVPGSRALAWFEAGHLAQAADAARAADADARRLGFSRHFFAVDYLRALSGLALEGRDLETAEQLTERVLSIAEQRQPLFEFLALLDRARIWAARGQVRDALTTLGTAREAVAGASASLLAWADEQEALLRLALGDLRSPAELASDLPVVRRGLLRARIALAAGDHPAVREHLKAAALGDLTPRQALVRQVLLAAAAIERGDPAAASMFGSILHTARSQGFLNTVITTAPQVTGYVVEHAAQLRPDSFLERLVAAALEVRAAQPGTAPSSRVLTEPLTAAEQRILTLLPTSTYLQIADTLYVSRNTVKSHLRSIYQKLGVASRSGSPRAGRRPALALTPRPAGRNHPRLGDDLTRPLEQYRKPAQEEACLMRIVIALGGNALLRRGEPMTTEVQRQNVRIAAQAIAPLATGHSIVVVHGNGPQVGLLVAAGRVVRRRRSVPAGRHGRGHPGHDRLPHPAGTAEPAAAGPPGGDLAHHGRGRSRRPGVRPARRSSSARSTTRTRPMRWPPRRAGRSGRTARRGAGWCPLPEPVQILELEPISWLLERGAVVICAGGGGIPTRLPSPGSGDLVGVEAVIDKDLASELLAENLRSDLFLMVTDVDGVYLDWGRPEQRRLGDVTPGELAGYEFAAGSMGPKVEAATRFVAKTGRRAAIGSLADIAGIVAGTAGTNVVAQKAPASADPGS